MGIRESLENKNVVIVILMVVIVGASYVSIKNWRSQTAPQVINTFYTDNDGSSYFGGELKDFIPGLKREKPRYRAQIFKNGGSDTKEFVGYLMRYSDDSIKAIDAAEAAAAALRANAKPGDPALLKAEEALVNVRRAADENPEVKLPGSGHSWVPFKSAEGQKLTLIKRTDGKDLTAVPVYP